MTTLALIGLFLAALVAGAINSVAGGGTLISFPSLIAAGVPAITANATNTASLWPGALASALAYRKDTPVRRDVLLTLLPASVIGGFAGAWVLVITPEAVFAAVVPFLVLFATVLFALASRIARWAGCSQNAGEHVTALGRTGGFLFQLLVATYGGYFGAGIGILMLASLAIMGLQDIHRMNAVKTTLGTVINVIAFVFFAVEGLIDWPIAAVMTGGAVLGGFLGARGAKRVDQRLLRAFIIATGLIISAWLFLRV